MGRRLLKVLIAIVISPIMLIGLFISIYMMPFSLLFATIKYIVKGGEFDVYLVLYPIEVIVNTYGNILDIN